MASHGQFICGCDPKDEKVRNYSTEIRIVNGEKVLSNKRYNRVGDEVCPIHGQPMYGFASLTKVGPQGNEIVDWKAEFHKLYGKADSKLTETEIPDIRDNRDPAKVGEAFLAEREAARAAQTNGKAQQPVEFHVWDDDRDAQR